MKPAPCAAPTLPIPDALSLLLVMSAMCAWATAVSVANPAAIRDKRSMRKELASAKRRKLAVEVKMDIIRIGFLPMLSDILPNIGEKVNCINENEATKIPNAADPAWKVFV